MKKVKARAGLMRNLSSVLLLFKMVHLRKVQRRESQELSEGNLQGKFGRRID